MAQVSLKSWGKPQIQQFGPVPLAGNGYFWNNGVVHNHVSPSRIFLEGFLCLPGIPAGRRGLQEDGGCVPTIHYKLSGEKGMKAGKMKAELGEGAPGKAWKPQVCLTIPSADSHWICFIPSSSGQVIHHKKMRKTPQKSWIQPLCSGIISPSIPS